VIGEPQFDRFEWGGADVPGFRQAALDEAMEAAEQRYYAGHPEGPPRRITLTGHQALIWLQEHPPEHRGPE